MKKAEGPYESARRMGERVPGNLRAAVEEGLILPDYYAPVQGGSGWSDGRRYARYYVPLAELRLALADRAGDSEATR